ncbi:glucan 1,4-alpha-maltotetraohydrolase domain-containing protein [Nonlabens xiamenensis]|uniref:glucan 1,4-alpha-maltotetraohydrolase domain-containing protein n=1 Tax=Nonlabens xiamenensis TaxID=2341043 RepID=UPI000F6072C9|nr:glucan 1,4-alpha-maltotetraohydrolase domain-containing protein [Nonlabens xiamenensis]
MKKLNFFHLFFVAVLLNFSLITAQVPNDDRIMLQGFYWESAQNNPGNWYNIINSTSQELADMGIDLIWLPPPSDAGSLEGYLPRELNNFSTSYGNLSEHQAMLNALNSKGIEAIADIVINHRVGNTNYVDFANPAWGTDAITSNDEVWQVPAYYNTYPRGAYDTGTSYEAARDIDHTKPYVQNSIIQFLNNLKALGYSGWRYDFVHGFDPYYFTLYNNATNPTISVGENYNSNKQVVQDWIDNSGSGAFDFPSYFTLKSVVRDNNYSYLSNNGQASGGIGWDPKNYVTFVENHDTPRYDTPNNVLNGNNVGQTYAYLLTHPGVPCIYWPHLMDWGATVKTQIKDLISVRKDAGIHSQSNLSIQAAQNGLYAAVIDGDNYQVAMKMGPNNWSPSGSGWNLATSGNNYAVWTKSTGQSNNSFTVYTKNFSSMYTWDDNQNATNGSWPGVSLTDQGNGWVGATVSGNCSNIIFSNNGSSQTPDLYTCSDQPYYYQGNWYATDPTAGSSPSSFQVYVKNFTHAYTWDDNLNATNGSWPGGSLSDAGNGYKTISINGSCSNVIFSYNGSSQTADLSTCSNTPYYYNNSWHAGPEGKSLISETSMVNTIYPNPLTAESKLLIDISQAGVLKVELLNISGQQVAIKEFKLEPGTQQVSLEELSGNLDAGFYLCRYAGIADGVVKVMKN